MKAKFNYKFDFLFLNLPIVQKKGYMDLQGTAPEDVLPCFYGATLPKDATCTALSSWAIAEPSTFLIRGESYLHDSQKVMKS